MERVVIRRGSVEERWKKITKILEITIKETTGERQHI